MAEIDRWALERACWARGIALVCGCDEAGAGHQRLQQLRRSGGAALLCHCLKQD